MDTSLTTASSTGSEADYGTNHPVRIIENAPVVRRTPAQKAASLSYAAAFNQDARQKGLPGAAVPAADVQRVALRAPAPQSDDAYQTDEIIDLDGDEGEAQDDTGDEDYVGGDVEATTETDADDDTSDILTDKRYAPRTQQRIQQLANERKQAAEEAKAAREELIALKAELDAWKPGIEQWRQLGFKSHADLQAAIVADQERQAEQARQARVDQSRRYYQSQIDEGYMDQDTAGAHFRADLAEVEKERTAEENKRLQSARNKELTEISETRRELRRELALTRYPQVKGNSLFERMVKLGDDPVEAAESLVKEGQVVRNTALNNAVAAGAKNNRQSPPVSGGRDRQPHVAGDGRGGRKDPSRSSYMDLMGINREEFKLRR